MSNPIVKAQVVLYFTPVVMEVEIDTREDGEWNAARVKTAAKEIANDRYRHGDEHPELSHMTVVIK